jgi:glycosyltransferase involved in cell wall biosynthesis
VTIVGILIAAVMRILLVGNYSLDGQSSMLRYAETLSQHAVLRGHEVEMIQPQAIVGNLFKGRALRKWFGYIDKYLIFPMKLRFRSSAFDIVHICDHSNSMYLAHTSGRPAGITCHDLLAIASAQGRYKQQHISFSGRLQQRWILKGIAAARNVVCVSSNTARELAAFTNEEGSNVVVIPNPLNFDYAPAPVEEVLATRSRLGMAADERYLLHVGANHWYKNRLGVLRIFQLFNELLRASTPAPPRLVMAGQPLSKEMRDFITAHGLQDRVIEVVDPSNKELRALYSGAAALLFPSLYEGFGWPLIEAQSCGCPVITSNRPPMTEIAGSAALYVDPEDETAAAALIAANLDRLHLFREGGFRNVKRFDSNQIGQAYESFFATVARDATSDGRSEPPKQRQDAIRGSI